MVRAFSLVEVGVTVLIIGVMAAVAMPQISGAVQRERTASNAARIVDVIQAARETARETVCPAELIVEPTQIAIRSHERGGSGGAVVDLAATCNLNKVDVFRTKATGIGFGVFDFTHCTQSLLHFNEDGTVFDATNRVTLPLLLDDGRRWTVEIWPGSGAVRLNRG